MWSLNAVTEISAKSSEGNAGLGQVQPRRGSRCLGPELDELSQTSELLLRASALTLPSPQACLSHSSTLCPPHSSVLFHLITWRAILLTVLKAKDYTNLKRGGDFSIRFPSIISVHSHHSRGVGGRHNNSHFLVKETEAQGAGASTAQVQKCPHQVKQGRMVKVIWSGGCCPVLCGHHST